MSTTDNTPFLLLPGEGEDSAGMLIKMRAHELGGAFSVMEAHVEPDQLLIPHTHDTADQAVFVIEGELIFEVGGEGGTVFAAPAGSYVKKPAGVSHGFWNKGAITARYIELSAGEAFEHFVDDADREPLEASVTAPIEHGVTFHFERVPALMRAHGLTSLRGAELSGPVAQKVTGLIGRFAGA